MKKERMEGGRPTERGGGGGTFCNNKSSLAKQEVLFCILEGALLHGKRCPFDV